MRTRDAGWPAPRKAKDDEQLRADSNNGGKVPTYMQTPESQADSGQHAINAAAGLWFDDDPQSMHPRAHAQIIFC
jgi:hypothetical protein